MKSMIAKLNELNEFSIDFRVKNYKTFNDKVVVVEFSDGTTTKAVCDSEDNFSVDAGLAICLLKKAMGGSDKYNDYIRKLMKEHEMELYKEPKKQKKTCNNTKQNTDDLTRVVLEEISYILIEI